MENCTVAVRPTQEEVIIQSGHLQERHIVISDISNFNNDTDLCTRKMRRDDKFKKSQKITKKSLIQKQSTGKM